jgi:ElaB/YqjD/DUF883 family membrane-anchored ribosome-binding protein
MAPAKAETHARICCAHRRDPERELRKQTRDFVRSYAKPKGIYREFAMNKDSFETTARSPVSGDEYLAENLKDKFKAEGSGNGSDSPAIDFPGLRSDIAKLTQTVSKLLERQTSTARDQLASAVGAAGDNIAQSASGAHDKLTSFEEGVGSQIRNNPWSAIAIAGLLGFLMGKVT